MSDILIRGMELPIFEHQSWDIRHGDDGKWYIVDTNAETTDGKWHEIVPVPPHGDLIDRTAIISVAYRDKNFGGFWGDRMAIEYVEKCANNAPTIIPASE